MKLIDTRDDNGNSLQSFAEAFLDKAEKHNATVVILVMQPPDQLTCVTNVAMAGLPDALSQLAKQLRKTPKGSAEIAINPKETQTDA